MQINVFSPVKVNYIQTFLIFNWSLKQMNTNKYFLASIWYSGCFDHFIHSFSAAQSVCTCGFVCLNYLSNLILIGIMQLLLCYTMTELFYMIGIL